MHFAKRFNPTRAISASLVWLVLGAVIPLLVFGVLTASVIVSQKRSSLTNDLTSTAAALSVAVDRELINQFKTMNVLAAVSLSDTDDLRGFNAQARQALKANPTWINIGLLDPRTARIIAGAPVVPDTPTYSLSPARVAEVTATRKAVIAGTFSRGQLTPVPVVILMTPVMQDDQVRYVLGIAMKPDALSNIFHAQGMDSTWTGATLDDRMIISGRSRDAERYVGTPATDSLQDQLRTSKAGLFTATTKEGDAVYTVFRRSDETGWSVVIGVPTAEMNAPLRTGVLELALAGLVLVCVTAAAATYVGRGIVVTRGAYEQTLKTGRRELTEALDRLTNISASLPGVVFQFRRVAKGEYSVPYASNALKPLHGVFPEQVQSDAKLAFAVVHPDDLPLLLESIEQSAVCLAPWKLEYRVRAENGQVRWLFGNAVPQLEEDGAVLWHGFITDITAQKAAEEQARQDNLKFQVILEGAPDAIFITDQEGYYQYVNDAATSLLGYSRQQLLRMHIRDITPQRESQAVMVLFETLKAGQFARAELHLVRSDKSDVAVAFYGTMLPDGHIYGSCRDVTSRIRAQQALQESETHLQTIFETEPDCLCILDPDGNILQINPAGMEVLTATTVQAITGLAFASFIVPPYRDGFREMVTQVAAGKRIAQAFEIESGNARRHWLEAQAVPMQEHGRSAVLIVARDATERRRIEAELKTSREELEDLYENAPCGYHSVDVHGCFQRMNRTELNWLGYTREEVIGKRGIADILSPGSLPMMKATFERFRNEGLVRDVTVDILRKDGSTFSALVNATAIYDADGRFLASRSTLFDLTEHIKAEEKVRTAEDRFRQFFEKNSSVMLLINPVSGLIMNANQTSAQYYGYTLAQLIGMPIAAINTLPADQVTAEIARATHESKKLFRFRHRLANGQVRDVEVHSTPFDTVDGPLLLSIIHDVTERTINEQRVHQLAFYDTLTQLPNRRLLSERMHEAMTAGKRSKRHCALAFIDLDNFKPLNDQHGHSIGDLLLIEVAQRIRKCIREIDTVARFGGDEFVVLLRDLDEDRTTALQQAIQIGEKIRLTLAQTYLLQAANPGGASGMEPIRHICTASIGITVFTGKDTTEDAVQSRADSAMYQAKSEGRNRICIAD